ncbi:MAG: hypothetical protein AAFX04_10330 [Pseudomonadota bacterium]
MFWDNTRKTGKATLKAALAAAIVSGAFAAATVPAMAQSVVVRSTGPSASQYPAGKKLAADARITLKSGDVITVLDKAGTRVLRGPQTVSLNRRVASNSRSSGMASLLTTRSNRRARTGAVRSAGTARAGDSQAPVRSPNLWFVDTSRPGIYCIVDPKATVLWRKSVRSGETATLVSASGGGSAAIEWRRGNALKRWPVETVPLADGGSYSLAMPDATEPAQITVRMMADVPEALDDIAAALIDRGCQRQLDLLVDTLGTEDATDAATTDMAG